MNYFIQHELKRMGTFAAGTLCPKTSEAFFVRVNYKGEGFSIEVYYILSEKTRLL